MRFSLHALCFTFACLSLIAVSHAADAIEVVPTTIELSDAYARRQILVSVGGRDATREVKYESLRPEILSVDERGYVTPKADGQGTVRVVHNGAEAKIAVTVSGVNTKRPVDFATEIVPLLSRYGCNSGGCHGKQRGQNGFQLSLFGFDTKFDYQTIVQEARGRRVFASAATNSLMLLKATGAVPHGGGKRFDRNDEAFHLFAAWIEAGAAPAAPNAAQVRRIRVLPNERSLKRAEQQQLAVLAEYSDGSQRDVTRQTDFGSNLDVVAVVDKDGLVVAGEQTGEATIMARYMGQVSIFRALVPHAPPLANLEGFEANNKIDELAAVKWKKLGLRPSPVADDATFMRRVMIDLCGRAPTVEEAKAFLANQSPQKRNELINQLLESPDYPAFFALRWGAILRNSNLAGSDDASYAFHNWLKSAIARNVPYDEMVRGIVAAAGEWKDAPAINWYWQSRDDQLHQTTADTAQVFLGLRLQCARCHHHPYERWTQEDYYGLTGFFTRLGRKGFGQPPPYFASASVTTGEKNPLTDKAPEPKYLDGPYAKFTPEEDPRHGLVDWMVKPENPFFAKTLVNRLWGHFLGRGLVHEVDDLRETNPPSNPELLDFLAQDFIAHRFDMKHTIRQIVSSKTYQLASEPTEHNQTDRQNFARFYGRRLIAEVLLDAVDQACGTRSQFSGIGKTARAVDLPHENFGSYFLDAFDRPKRVTGCECERSSGATLAQVLLLSNSDEIENKVGAGEGRVAKLIAAKKPTAEMIEELYLAVFSRRPTAAEQTAVEAYLAKEEDKRKALEDVLWSLLNSREFLFNH